jgi:hypothetical protein
VIYRKNSARLYHILIKYWKLQRSWYDNVNRSLNYDYLDNHMQSNIGSCMLGNKSRMFRIVFWDVLPCKMIVDRRFRGAYCLHHQGSVDNHFARQYIPEDNSEHHTRRCENLKSHKSRMDCRYFTAM